MPGGDKKINGDDGKRFSATYQPDNRGRKVRPFKDISAQFRKSGIEQATPDVVKDVFEWLLALPLSDILAISGNLKVENEMPALYRMVANLMMGKQGLQMLQEMLNRAHGRPTTKLAMTDANGNDKDGGIFIFLPDNNRCDTTSDQAAKPEHPDKKAEKKSTQKKKK